MDLAGKQCTPQLFIQQVRRRKRGYKLFYQNSGTRHLRNDVGWFWIARTDCKASETETERMSAEARQTDHYRIPGWQRNLPLSLLLLLNAMLLLAPKAMLILVVNKHLWGDITVPNLPGAIAQDFLVSLAVSITVVSLLRKPTWFRVLASALLGGGILLLLMVDMRVRQIWLQPIDLTMVRYALNSASDLTSGFELFFNRSAFYSITFRKLLFMIVAAYICIWCLIGWTTATRRQATEFCWSSRMKLIVIAVAALLVLMALSAPQYRYRMNENVLVGYPFAGIQAVLAREGEKAEQRAVDFEQKPSPIASQRGLERRILRDTKPFKNVVVVVYESIRWRDINVLGGGPTLAPVLAKMAANGMVSKSYVSVPHSSKAYFAILTGRHPYPGIEMRELFNERNETLWHYLKATRDMKLNAFSSLNLGFEGMGRLLETFGIDSYETLELARQRGITIASASSFGTDDQHLYTLGRQAVSRAGHPFAAVFFPMAAHYPYECKGSVVGRRNRQDYDACVVESDMNLGILFEEFRHHGLMQDTLFVVVGDHGESFGEHGTWVHNSSMYDEEVTVPLVFWSEDGRLRQPPLRYSRQIDIVPTIADLMGAMEAEVQVQGTSLLRQQNPTPPAFMATFFDGLGAALFEAPHKYIYEPSTGRLLAFDHTNDPLEDSPVKVPEDTQRSVRERIRAFISYQEQAFPAR